MKFFSKAYFEVLFIIGLSLSVLTSLNHRFGFLPDFLGGACAGLGIVLLLLAGALKHNKRFIKKIEIAKSDERIRQITSKAGETALYVTMITAALGAIVLGTFGEPFMYASIALAVMAGLECLVFYIAKARYSRMM